jgi:soluble lytic murein transglycosylase-like protein
MTWLESGWQQTVVSHTGARGVGQLMPATVDFVRDILIRDRSLDVNDVDDNIRMSARYLRWLLDQAGGDHSLALAGYYQGMAAVRKHGVYTGTRTYVAGVLAFRDRYGWR